MGGPDVDTKRKRQEPILQMAYGSKSQKSDEKLAETEPGQNN